MVLNFATKMHLQSASSVRLPCAIFFYYDRWWRSLGEATVKVQISGPVDTGMTDTESETILDGQTNLMKGYTLSVEDYNFLILGKQAFALLYFLTS